MMTRHLFPALILTLALAGCSRLTPEQQFINDATAALGGRSRIDAVKTLTIEGTGVNYNLGQDMKPDAATQTFEVTGYKRQIDIANGRQRVEQTRTPKFAYFQGPQPQTQIQSLDGPIAFNLNAAGAAARLGPAAEVDRRLDLFHHPVALLRSAISPSATVANVRLAGPVRQADITTATGEVLTLSLDAGGLPLSISSKTYHANLGDVVITTTFGDYQDVNGLKLPARSARKVDDFTIWELRASRQQVDAEIGDLAAPAAARETVPGKPLTQLVTTHHHFDHTAGLRAAIAEGLTIITHAGNAAWVENMATRPHTRQPDALARHPKPVTVETVDGQREFKDAAMALTLYHVAGNPHSDTMLMAYVRRERVLIQVDAFSPGGQTNPYAANLLENIQSRTLAVARIVPLHGAIAPMADLIKAAQ